MQSVSSRIWTRVAVSITPRAPPQNLTEIIVAWIHNLLHYHEIAHINNIDAWMAAVALWLEFTVIVSAVGKCL